MNYLASPYSHPDPKVKEARYRAALKCLAHFTNEGRVIFSPIVHSYPIEIHHSLPGDWQFWQKFDYDFISRSDELWILMIDGWQESVGVKAEIEIALELCKGIKAILPVDDGDGGYEIRDYLEVMRWIQGCEVSP